MQCYNLHSGTKLHPRHNFFWLREMISDQFIINNVDVSNVKEVILDVHVNRANKTLTFFE